METRRHIFGGLVLAVAALLCLAGCKKDEEGEKVVLGVDFEQTAGTQKTYIGNEDKTIYWSTDDSVKVNGKNYLVHDGVVEVALSDDGYAAVYPKTATLNGTAKNCTGGSVEIPATQTYTTDANGVQRLDAPMAARLDTKTGRLLFRNLYAVVKVTVKAKETEAFTLNSITVESTNSVNLAGTQPFTFDAATNTATPTLGSLSNGSKSVTLNFENPVTIPANNSASFYLYTAEFSEANLTVKLNGNLTDKESHARNGVSISRSQLRGTTVDAATATSGDTPSGAFSVSATKKVYFSPGNLQWSATNGGSTSTTHAVAGDSTAAGTWRFAEHQWDYVGDATNGTVKAGSEKCNNASIASDYMGWIDLFGWGTSGWGNGNTFYQPYDCNYASTASSNAYGYGPTDGKGNYLISLTGDYANADWGVYNAIYNPKTGKTDNPGTWRTLTKVEWAYLLGTGTGTRGANSGWWIYNMVTITGVGNAGVTGLIIYPDGVTAKPEGVTADLTKNNKTAVAITKAEFETLEAMGCVFLPAAGYRGGTTLDYAGIRGYYWSSTYGNNYDAMYLYFRSGSVVPLEIDYRYDGNSVRLVKDVE